MQRAALRVDVRLQTPGSSRGMWACSGIACAPCRQQTAAMAGVSGRADACTKHARLRTTMNLCIRPSVHGMA